MDEQDFERIVALHYPRIRRAALLLSGGNEWDADDLAHETLLQAARGSSRFAGKSQEMTWLYSILLNQQRKQKRSIGRLWRRWRGWLERNPTDEMSGVPDRTLVTQEWNASLWKSVARLPAPQREAVVLRFAEDLSYEEIAGVLGCPIGTVKSRLHHALATLQQNLSEHELSSSG